MVKKMAMLDWQAMKYYHKRAILVPLFGFLTGIFFFTPLVIPSCAMMSLIYSINAFAVEDKGELNQLYLTLPVGRDTIVKGRFALSISMGLCGIIVGIPVMLLGDYFVFSHYYYPVSWNAAVIAFAFFVFALCNLSSYPLLFRLGYSKGKLWGFYLPLLAAGIIYGAIQTVISTEKYKGVVFEVLLFAGSHVYIISVGLVLLSILLLFISFILSKYFYSKREF